VHHTSENQPITLTSQNPFKNDLKVQVTSETAGRILLYIMNVNGVILAKNDMQIEAGTNIISLKETGNLPKGVYFIKGIKDNEATVLRLLKE